jgi:hypothetical protein
MIETFVLEASIEVSHMEREMNRLSRRQVLGGAVATAAAVTLGAPSVHAQKRGQTIRFVAQADLKILDPVWTTAYITRNHGYLVYDTLCGAHLAHACGACGVDLPGVNRGAKETICL